MTANLSLALPNMSPSARDLALSQFDTPRLLADRIARWANIKKGMSVLEPSAGLGTLALAAVDLGANVTCVEIDPVRCKYLEKIGLFTVNKDFLQATVIEHELALMNSPYENDQDLVHVLRALHFAPRVVALVRLAFVAGIERFERLWGRHTLTRMAVMSGRPKFSGMSGSGKFDSCVVEIVRGKQSDTGKVEVEWWGS